ncbi:FAD-binding oxidoreductase [Fictibacillus sp. Mic-4]|uniref:FAD-binding oxidoreductase n=1 Tax=Fictibacillus sp. Mic-4 TaxID=3132826 RepID=UPI003CF5A5DE
MVVTELEKIVDEKRIVKSGDEDPFGNLGKCTVYPQTEEEISAILTYASKNGRKVFVEGSGTKKGFGGLLEKADILLSLSHCKGVVEYSAGDLTITVRPGTTIKEIGEYLAPFGQCLSVDPAWPEFATIGGVIAANSSGPKRLKYGSARDFVIGLRVVYPDGKVIRTGGKVVKNVAGYDMNKLFVGSMGTLGVISEVTVKLRPLPKYESLVLLSFSEKNLHEIRSFVIQLLDSMMEPVSLELVNPTLSNQLTGLEGYTLFIGLEGIEKSVLYQEMWIKEHQPKETELIILQQHEAKKIWSTFAKLAPNPLRIKEIDESNLEIGIKIGSKNIDVIELVEACHLMSLNKHVDVRVHGGTGHGITKAYVKGNTEAVLSYVRDIRSAGCNKGGYAIVEHAPYILRKHVNVWGDPPSYFSLLEGIKKAIDPNNVLNTQRFVGGL